MILAHEFMEVAPPQLRRVVLQEVYTKSNGEQGIRSEVWSRDEIHQLIQILKYAHPKMRVIGFNIAEYCVLRVTVTEEEEQERKKK